MSEGNGHGEPAASAAPPPPPAPPAVAPAVEATEAARLFIDAVVWGDHERVWERMGAEGRTEVLDVAKKRGMDEGLAARLGSGSASPSEMNEFLVDLVNGLRAELAGNDLDHITYELDEAASGGDRAEVIMHVPLHPLLGGTLPVGTLFLAIETGAWMVEKLLPLTSK